MSDTNTNDTSSTEDQAGTGGDPVAELQAEVEKWKALARKHEQRSTSDMERIKQLEDDSKTEADKVAERIAALEAANAKATADALRLRVAAKHQISDEDADMFLTATDEETLNAQAKRLSERNAETKRQATVVEGEGNQSTNTGGSEMREFASNLFGRKN